MGDILRDEHLLLGALMSDEGSVPPVTHYLEPGAESASFVEGAALVDLSGMVSRLMSGAPARTFAEAAFAGRTLDVGSCAFEAALLGDGSLSSVALLARTGDAEYVAWDLTDRAEVLAGWLEFLSTIEQSGVAPFAGLELEDVGEAFVPLLLCGPAAPTILADYLGDQELPTPGTVASLRLDRIGCVVVAPSLADTPAYLVLVPPRSARALWRSFLSFPVVCPVGGEGLDAFLADALPWYATVAHETDKLALGAGELHAWDLVRTDATFVGARGLKA